MEHLLELAKRNQERAWEVIRQTDIINIWKSVGAEINLVGSLNMGLLMKHKDIDFHIYLSLPYIRQLPSDGPASGEPAH